MTDDPDVHIIADGKRTEPVRLSEKAARVHAGRCGVEY
jgi:hypothetical protein